MAKQTLTDEQIEELRAWSPDMLELPVHRELEHQMRISMDGVEHAVVIGPRGVGKTRSVQWFKAEIEADEVERAMADDTYQAREILYYAASRATGTKTALIDLYEQLYGGISRASLRFHSATSLVRQIASEAERRGIALICVDEAQMIDPSNLDLLRQVPDEAREHGHRLGLILIGSEELRQALVEIKQLGQRFSSEIRFPRLTREQISPYLTGFHPHLPALERTLGEKAWNRLVGELFRATRGKFRRLVAILANANSLALALRRPIDEEILRLAIGKLADEE